MLAILAQASESFDPDAGRRLLWISSGVFAMLLLGAWLAMALAKRKARTAESESGGRSAAFSLDDLQRMHLDGELSDAEYRKARDGVLNSGIFSLQDLREMHSAGEIDDIEFNRSKAAILDRTKAMLARDAAGET